LARLALESTIPTGGTARLHARLLDALEGIELQDHAVLTHHALAAGDAVRAARHARAAAEDAARSGSHTEAAALYETALANLPGADPQERAQLLIRLANEQYMTGRLGPAIATVSATFPLWRGTRDETGLSTAHQSCAVFEYYNAHRREAEAHAERAATLAPRSAREFGVARATRGYLAYHRGDVGLLHECLEDAARIAEEVGDDSLALHGRMVSGINALALGDEGARDELVGVIEEAREHGYDEMASTGYSNLADLDVEHRRLADAERVLEESLAFTVERDIPICNHWQTGVRSRLRLLEGRTRAALEDAEEALERTGMPLATFYPHLVVGLAHLRRDGSDDGHLMAAWQLAERLDEQSRRLPALAALAERMWLTGVPDPLVTGRAAAELELASASSARSWSAGELAVWLARLGTPPAVDPAALPEPHRLVLTGQPDRAATWWQRAGCVVDAALTGLDATDPDARARAVERLDGLGAVATADRLRRTLRQEGVSRVPARPRASTRGNPSGLTNRQLDVARLVARGFTNAQIAERLFISPKTADHHVSAVLMKLGTPNRRAVVVQAQELGLS
ncbi:MAG TPA: LuxR C-terminal-related transcriptional regulator, partial [Phycicoccus sp.]